MVILKDTFKKLLHHSYSKRVGLMIIWKQNLFASNLVFSPAGDYGSAIETLVTAISLIKQSKVSADDRCKVLISSLQDCLHGIESKSYGSGSR